MSFLPIPHKGVSKLDLLDLSRFVEFPEKGMIEELFCDISKNSELVSHYCPIKIN